MLIHSNCRHFRGDIPCRPHKEKGVHCSDCADYAPMKERILIIKLGAAGDVIRTTPLIHRIDKEFPDAELHWLTHSPEIVPSRVDRIFRFKPEDIEIIKSTEYDILYNLDKDGEACALASSVHAAVKKGFTLKNGRCAPIDIGAKDKWLTGLFDDVNLMNQKSYPQEIFEICGFNFQGEEYILEVKTLRDWNIGGIVTGCGSRWTTRFWPDDHWIKLAKLLKEEGYQVLFLGGEQEHEKNKMLSKQSGALYPGHFDLPEFIDLINQCTLVVTAVTMALHIALGLKKKVVLFNNIFNDREFELYGRGIILQPPRECTGCYRTVCGDPCMELIEPEKVKDIIKELLSE